MRIQITGIDEAIKTIENEIEKIKTKQPILLERLATIGIDNARTSYAQAQYDGTKDVTVSDIEWIDDHTVMFNATGSTVAFIEFGTGVHYSSPVHPKASEYGAVRGGYGYHLGRFDSWRYKGDPGTNGELITDGVHKGMIKTHGNPASRSMYDSGKLMRESVEEIIKEVYGS